MTNINDEKLDNVTGGTSREKHITVEVPLHESKKFTGNITIKPYLNGEIQTDLIKTVDASLIPSVFLTFSGRGKMSLIVKLDDVVSIEYVLDFDDSSYIKL